MDYLPTVTWSWQVPNYTVFEMYYESIDCQNPILWKKKKKKKKETSTKMPELDVCIGPATYKELIFCHGQIKTK